MFIKFSGDSSKFHAGIYMEHLFFSVKQTKRWNQMVFRPVTTPVKNSTL